MGHPAAQRLLSAILMPPSDHPAGPHDTPSEAPPRGPSADAPALGLAPWWIFPAFLALAAFLAGRPPRADAPIHPTAIFPLSQITPGPVRAVLSDPPSVVVGGYTHNCNDCHRLFQSAPERHRLMSQHTHIALSHGLNDRCFNCHDREDRQKFVLRDGRTVPFVRVATLCSQCHGTTYRDWERGMHGKDLGSWSPHVRPQRRLVCTECHDPHAPAYPDYKPLPGPRTLRMGDPPEPTHGTKHDPLGQWRPHHPPESREPESPTEEFPGAIPEEQP